jgi:fused signal recognition particle receptor
VTEDEAPPRELEQGLRRSRGGFMARLRGLLTGDSIPASTWADVEESLIAGDIGADLAMRVVEQAREHGAPGGAVAAVRRELAAVLLPRDPAWELAPARDPSPSASSSPAVVLIVGVNGTGKTTSIGKLATRESVAGRRVILAAADTFRAAASEQLRIWADRANADMVSHAAGADPAAVVFDALDAAVARRADVVLIDTAGRLHTKSNLMDELAKIRRVINRRLPDARPETLLVLDATTGQNGLAQAIAFHEAVELTGIILTKLDSTSRGGIVFAIEQELGVPVRFAGVGERPEDLIAFDPSAFVEALFEDEP